MTQGQHRRYWQCKATEQLAVMQPQTRLKYCYPREDVEQAFPAAQERLGRQNRPSSANGKRWMMTKPFVMTPIYDRLLRGSDTMPLGLYHLHLATAEQLCRLHYRPGVINAVKARLKTLCDHGYVQYGQKPSAEFRAPYYYTLAGKGVRYLAQQGMDVSRMFRPSKEIDKAAPFLDHTLEVNDLLISAAILRQVAPAYHLRCFIHERTLKRHPYQASWQGGRATITPDAFLDFGMMDTKRRLCVLLEHDRGTEEQQFFRKRIQGYLTFLKAKAQKTLFGVDSILVAFSTFKGERRRRQMCQWTEAELANEPRAIGMAFYFAALDHPPEPHKVWVESVWYTAYKDDQTPQALLAM